MYTTLFVDCVTLRRQVKQGVYVLDGSHKIVCMVRAGAVMVRRGGGPLRLSLASPPQSVDTATFCVALVERRGPFFHIDDKHGSRQ